MDNIQRIKEKLQELVVKSNQERSEEDNPNHSNGFGLYWSGFCNCLKEIIPFVDSLPKESEEWSDEDINMIDWLIRCCEKEYEELCNDRYGHQEIVSDLKRDCRKKWDWLESLKSRLSKDKV